MPYIATGRTDRALLTTAHYTFYYEWGSIVANNSDHYVPAKWITPQKESPGVIWYWINENDCDAGYKPGNIIVDVLDDFNARRGRTLKNFKIKIFQIIEKCLFLNF